MTKNVEEAIYEECNAIITEAIFNHRFELLQGYHSLGALILESGVTVEDVARKIGHRVKDVHYAVELAKKYPDIDSVPDGKSVSWYKITKTLPSYRKP